MSTNRDIYVRARIDASGFDAEISRLVQSIRRMEQSMRQAGQGIQRGAESAEQATRSFTRAEAEQARTILELASAYEDLEQILGQQAQVEADLQADRQRWSQEQRTRWEEEQARIQAEMAHLGELTQRWQEYHKKGGRTPLPTSRAGWQQFEKELEVQEQAVEKQAGMYSKIMEEMTKIGVLRGGVEWRFARAMGGAPLAILATLMIVDQAVTRIRKAVDQTVESLTQLSAAGSAMQAFQSLSAGATAGFDGFAQSVREASGYVLTNYDAWTRGNKLLIAGFDDLAAAMPELAETARVMGAAFGVDAKQQLDALVEAIKKGDVEALEATWGFQGVSAAVRKTASDMGVGVDSLNKYAKATTVLNTIMPQTQEMVLRLGGGITSAGDAMRAWWEDVDRIAKAIRTSAAYEVMQLIGAGGTPTAMEQRALVKEQRVQIQMAWQELYEAYEKGIVTYERLQQIWQEGFVGLYLRHRGAFVDTTSELKWQTEILEEMTMATLGLSDAQQEAARAAKTMTAEERALSEAMEQANSTVEGRVQGWAVQLTEFFPVDEAVARARELGDKLYDALEGAVTESGSMASVESLAVIAEIDRDWSALLERLKANSVNAIRDAALAMRAEVWNVFRTTVLDASIAWGLQLGAGMPFEEATALYKELEEQRFQWYLKYPTEEAQGSWIARWELQQMEAIYAIDKQQRDTIERQKTAWAIAASDYMPWEEAIALSERFGASLEAGIERWAEKLGGRTPEAISAALQTAQDLWDEYFIDIHKKSAYAYGEMGKELAAEAQSMALRLAPYLSFEEIQAFAEAVTKELDDWQEAYYYVGEGLNSLDAQYARERTLDQINAIVKAIEDANKETKASTRSMKDWASAMLLANLDLGSWAAAFTVEHGGRDPLQVYQRHEKPLMAAMIDKMWGEDFFAREGRAPTDAEWRQHWFDYWQQWELYPGGPILEPTGAEAERAKAMLEMLGIEDLGDIYNEDWKKRKGLIAEMDKEVTQLEKVNAAMEKFWGWINRITDEDGDEDDEDDEGGTSTGAAADMAMAAGKLGRAVSNIPEFQRGGYSATGGLAFLHPNELVMPMHQFMDSVAMRMTGGAGGNVNIESMSIPVTINGSPAMRAEDIQQAVVGAIRTRGGTEIVRSARRLGL